MPKGKLCSMKKCKNRLQTPYPSGSYGLRRQTPALGLSRYEFLLRAKI